MSMSIIKILNENINLSGTACLLSHNKVTQKNTILPLIKKDSLLVLKREYSKNKIKNKTNKHNCCIIPIIKVK